MDDWMISIVALFLGLFSAYLLLKYLDLKSQMESRARDMYEAWQER